MPYPASPPLIYWIRSISLLTLSHDFEVKGYVFQTLLQRGPLLRSEWKVDEHFSMGWMRVAGVFAFILYSRDSQKAETS
jgi:hypothetical protein